MGIFIHHEKNITSSTAVTAVGSPFEDKLLLTKRDSTRTALTGAEGNLYTIDKHKISDLFDPHPK